MSSDPRYTLFAARAVFDDRLTAMDVRVLAALGTFTDRQGWCHPSQTTIARRLKTSRPRVNGAIKALVDAGYVQAVQQSSEKKGREVSLYRVLMDISAPDAVEAVAQEQVADVVLLPPVPLADRGDVSGRDTPCTAGGTPPVPPADIELTPLEHSQRKRRASARLSPAWQPRAEEIEFGIAGGLSRAEVGAAGDHMRDWAAANAKSKADWDLTFRNWLRTTISDAKRGKRPVVATAFNREAALKVYREHGYWNPALGPEPELFSQAKERPNER